MTLEDVLKLRQHLKMFPIIVSVLNCLPVSLILQVSIFLYSLWWITRARARMEPLLDGTENKWSFGQVVPMVFILLVFITAAEICNGTRSPGRSYTSLILYRINR